MVFSRANRDILTGGKRYAQKKAKKHGVEEVTFDKTSREEYLTGFHKRKLQRQKKAQEFNKEQARLAKIQERKILREERAKEIQDRIAQYKQTVQRIAINGENEDHLGDLSDRDDEEWNGFRDNDTNESIQKTNVTREEHNDDALDNINDPIGLPKGILQKKEVYYIDPSQVETSDAVVEEETTVTVLTLDNPAIVDIQKNLETAARANNVDLQKSNEVLNESIKRAKNYAVLCGASRPITKKKKFRYLTKAERRENLRKEKSKKAIAKRK